VHSVNIRLATFDDDRDGNDLAVARCLHHQTVEHLVNIRLATFDDDRDGNDLCLHHQTVEHSANIRLTTFDDDRDSNGLAVARCLHHQTAERLVNIRLTTFDDDRDSNGLLSCAVYIIGRRSIQRTSGSPHLMTIVAAMVFRRALFTSSDGGAFSEHQARHI